MSIPAQQSRGSSPPLILLNPPNPRLTLLDYDEETSDPSFAPPREFELDPRAGEFRPGRRETVSLLEGILIDLPGGRSVVFRPAVGSLSGKRSNWNQIGRASQIKAEGARPVRNREQEPLIESESDWVDQPILFTTASEAQNLFQFDIQPSHVEAPSSTFFKHKEAEEGGSQRIGQLSIDEDEDEPLVRISDEHILSSFSTEIINDTHDYDQPVPVRITTLSHDDTESCSGESSHSLFSEFEATTEEGESFEEETFLERPARLVDVPSMREQELNWTIFRHFLALDLKSPTFSQSRPYRDDSDDTMIIMLDPESPEKATSYPDSPFHTLLSQPSPRRNIPPDILNPPIRDNLQSSMLHAWARAEPTHAERQHTVNLLERLSVALNARLGGPRASLERGYRRFEVDVFGSVSWGGETGQSGDLDLVVIDKEERQGYRPGLWKVPPTKRFSTDNRSGYGELPPVYNLRSVARVLWSIGMVDCVPIVHATTPIIKFKDASNGQECDLNVNDLGGWYNSSLILHYCMISPFVLRPLIHALKIWASTHDLNDAAGARGPATMSSYCLALMAIAYLQQRGVLPNLQQDVVVRIPSVASDTKDPNAVWVGWGKEQGMKALVGFERDPPYGWTPRDVTASEALRGFFEFFSTTGGSPGFDYQSHVVSILNGGFISRVEPQGAATRAESERRKELIGKGVSDKAITAILSEARASAAKRELSMGKGNIGIQPLKWGESKLVVQDPFLWSKNCAGAMTKIGVGRFQETINRTYDLIGNLGSDTTLHDILNGVVSTDSPIPKSRSRNKSRSSKRGGRGSPAMGGFRP